MNKSYNILNWNVRGINSSDKWLAISNKIEEAQCSVICLQETKREVFDSSYIKKIAPKELINLITCLLWEPLGDCLWLGMIICFRESVCSKMISPSPLDLFQFILEILGS